MLTDFESDTSCIQFAIHLQNLQRSRYVMNGRLDADARAHPDAVWGLRPDAMSHVTGVGGRSADSVRLRSDEGELKRSSGLEFSQGAHTLPAVRRPSPRLPSHRYHCIVPDSHVAVGAFVSNDGRGDDCDWRRYVRDRETLDRNAEYIAARNAELHELNSAITAASAGRDANRRRRMNGDGEDGSGGDGSGGDGSGAEVAVLSHWTRTLSNPSSPRLLPIKTRALTRTQHSMSFSRHISRRPATGMAAMEAVVAAVVATVAVAVEAEVGMVLEPKVEAETETVTPAVAPAAEGMQISLMRSWRLHGGIPHSRWRFRATLATSRLAFPISGD